ncbi:MAG: ATP-binding protein, partial [Chloroflexota bacterium]|nr:ATP-binding protein [Chloroflexota bacterium]
MKSVAPATVSWHEANQRYLTAALAIVRSRLEPNEALRGTQFDPELELHEAARAMPATPALETLCAAFELTSFEREILLLCTGVELDAGFAKLMTDGGAPRSVQPTFGLALATLPEAHWSALTPVAPLRRWQLIEAEPGDTLAERRLRIDERVLHYLTGIEYLDDRLSGIVE